MRPTIATALTVLAAGLVACGGHSSSSSSPPSSTSGADTPSAEGPPPSQTSVPTMTMKPPVTGGTELYLSVAASQRGGGPVGFAEGSAPMPSEELAAMEQRTDASAVANCNRQGASDCARIPGAAAKLIVLNTGPNVTEAGHLDQSCLVIMDSLVYRTYQQGLPYVVGTGATIDEATASAKAGATPDSPVRGSQCIKRP
jgi:hypothetical protein